MQTIERLNDLYSHMQWADALVWKSLLNSTKLSADERIQNLVYHSHLTQHAFLKIWTEQPLEFPRLSDFENPNSILTWGQEYYENLTEYLNILDPSALDGDLNIKWANRFAEKHGKKAEPTTLEESMLQVAMHSTYHRGQLNARIRELGEEPPLTDYIGWIWFGRPGPEWPEVSG